jgi:hypothetical protein
MLTAVKFILLAQSYIGAFFLMSWWHDDLQFAPWWFKTSVFLVVCVFLIAPALWMHLDDEQHKENSRRLERLQYLEKKHYFSD